MASTSQGPGEADRHGWNSLENYRNIHENRLNNHSFLDPNRPQTVAFDFFTIGGDLFVQVAGEIYCLGGIVVEVEKYLETYEANSGQIFVRSFSYRYNAYITGKHNVLRYDNGHDFDEYHRHVWAIETGAEMEERTITRSEFPTLGEMPDELEDMFFRRA